MVEPAAASRDSDGAPRSRRPVTRRGDDRSSSLQRAACPPEQRKVTTAVALGRSSAAPPRRRPPGRPWGSVAVVLLLVALTALALLLPHRAAPVRGALGLAFTATVTAFLYARAGRTATPSGWRWFASAMVVCNL